MEVDIIQMIGTIGGLITGGALGLVTKSGRLRAKADAMKAMIEAYEMRLKSLHIIIDDHNKRDIENTKRISELNHSLNDKTERIRDLTDKGHQSERELNVANERIAVLIEDRDEERRKKEYYKRWRCEKSSCNDPDGRRPPNSKLSAEKYKHPE